MPPLVPSTAFCLGKVSNSFSFSFEEVISLINLREVENKKE